MYLKWEGKEARTEVNGRERRSLGREEGETVCIEEGIRMESRVNVP